MIIISDIHLGKTNDSFMVDGIPSQTVDIRKRLSTMVARAKLTHQCIAVAGDVFNRVNPTTHVIAEFFNWLGACKSAGVQVYLIAGNHDAGTDWTNMGMFWNADLSNVTVITEPNEIMVREGRGTDEVQCAVLFWPHIATYQRELAEQGHGDVSTYIATRFPCKEKGSAKFIITHGCPVGREAYANDIFFEAGNAMTIDFAAFPRLVLMVLGHIHDHTSGGRLNWVCPGSLTINNFGEVDERKGWVEVDLLSLTWQWYAFPDDVTPWVHVELDLTEKDETSLDEKKIEKLVSGVVVKITVLAKAHGVVNEVYIRRLFSKYGHVSRFETVIIEPITGAAKLKSRLSHQELLEEYLKNTDAKEVEKLFALKMGAKIIEEVRA